MNTKPKKNDPSRTSHEKYIPLAVCKRKYVKIEGLDTLWLSVPEHLHLQFLLQEPQSWLLAENKGILRYDLRPKIFKNILPTWKIRSQKNSAFVRSGWKRFWLINPLLTNSLKERNRIMPESWEPFLSYLNIRIVEFFWYLCSCSFSKSHKISSSLRSFLGSSHL